MAAHTICIVLSPDRHALQVKDGLEQLLEILGPSIKRLFHSKRTFIVTNILFEWKRRLDHEFEATIPDRLSPVGHGDLGTRLLFACDAFTYVYLLK